MTQLAIVRQILQQHGWLAGQTPEPSICNCNHRLQGTGVFYQSVGLIWCPDCTGWQLIRKPVT